MKLLLLYTTREHQTEKIMKRLQFQLGSLFECHLVQLHKNTKIKLSDYQAVIIGTSIRYGYYSKLVKMFIDANYCELNQMISGFFGVNLVARKDHKNTPETNLYTKKFLSKIQWLPTIKAVFAGALYYPQYNWFDRNMIRFIMWLGKGDTDITKPVIEYTDWNKVDQFAKQFAEMTTL